MSRTHVVRVYKGYNIDLVAKPAYDGQFYSTFTVRDTSGALVHMEDRDAKVICSSEEEANADAERRAYAWADTRPT